MSSRRTLPLLEIMEETFQVIPADQDEEDVAYAFNQYHLISAPVVDGDGRLVGAITIDDAMVVLDEEHEEDILRLAGVGEGSLSDRVIETTKQRLPWLAVNLVTAIAASMVISQFEAAIAQIVALAVLIDRRFSRELRIDGNFVGRYGDSIGAQHVKVFWSEEGGEDRVILLNCVRGIPRQKHCRQSRIAFSQSRNQFRPL